MRDMSVCLHWCFGGFSHKHLMDRSDMLSGPCTANSQPWATVGQLEFGFNLEKPQGRRYLFKVKHGRE